MTAKRKRVDLDLSAKIDILKQVDNNVKRKDIADKYGIDVSTLSKLVKNRDRIAEVILGTVLNLHVLYSSSMIHYFVNSG
jgi:hypothetical protein